MSVALLEVSSWHKVFPGLLFPKAKVTLLLQQLLLLF
jgi:hypothetical protein